MMKKIISFFTALSMTLMLFTGIPISVSAAENIAINATNFPDEVFRNYILTTTDGNGNKKFDKNGNGILEVDEIASVTEITITGRNVSSLKGIEFFTELTHLDCEFLKLTELDVSKNTALTYLKCDDNKISELDVSKNTALTYLDCSYNALTELDVSNNTELTYLGCGGSNKFSELDVSKNIKLTYLSCGFTGLPELDVSKNTELTELACNSDSFTALDISNNTKLTNLLCGNNNLTELDVSKNTELSTLHCYSNQLTKLDVSKNTKLTRLTCQNNQLASVDVSNNTLEFIIFTCNNNKHPVSTCMLEPTAFPAGFDLSKASNWTNAEITDDNKIFYLGTGDVTYTYDCGNGKTATFTLVFPSRDLTKVEAKDATCTEDGNIEYYKCSCGYKFKNENPAAADILSDEDVVTAATGHKFSTEWTSDSTSHWHAADCGHDVVSDKAVHNWDNGTVTIQPTETTEGVKTFTCTVCSATKTEIVDKLTHIHTLTAHDAVSATCTTDGNKAYWTCSGCNKIFSDENGITEITAIPTIPATGHKFSTEWTSDSTSHWHSATCGHDVTSEAAAHTEDGGTVTTPPTTENDGEKTYACSVCGYVMRTVAIPKLGEEHTHSFSPDWKHDSTNHWHECDCGVKSDNSAHTENGGVVTTEPTETSTGIMTYSCEMCGYIIRTDIIPALIPEHNHTFGTDWKYDSVSHWHECECGEKSELAGHTSSDWIVETPATTDLEGVQIRKCTVCGIELDRETIEKLPNISTGDVVEGVQDNAGTNAGLVQDNTLIENVLTPEDNIAVENGSSFEIVLEVTDIRDSVPADDVAAASSALRYNEQIGIYVDLSLFKIKDNSERTPIYNTSGRIGITLTVPDSIYASDRTYSIIRVHDGIAENLGGTYDKASRRLTFHTDKFSTYAIAYTASNSGTNRPSVPNTPTNPSVPTYPNTPVVPVTPTVTETTVKKEEEVISDEPYVEDVSSAAGIYENGETDNSIHYVMILIFAAAAGIAVIAAKKHFCKKNMK